MNFKKTVETTLKSFKEKKSKETKYLYIINLGKSLPTFPEREKKIENKVLGCLSNTYLISNYKNNLVFFKATSDSLISKGLAALLINIYNEQPLKTIINNPPYFLKNLNLHTLLSPNRINGIFSIYSLMKEKSISIFNNLK
ncbi:MAG: hypothetical protein AMS24_03735 [Chlamydiae bacterium SM23_39]|nr:MAG: hypothetical protein AMS24_03735 [Chlamydiae bacterium SM23_39]